MNHSAINTKQQNLQFHWHCKHTWNKSGKNTFWCLLGCSIGDFGTILFFQLSSIAWPTLHIMILAIVNGIITSLILETIILFNQMGFKKAFQTAIGMSFLSMIAMEISMNTVDWLVVGSAKLIWWVIPLMLLAGFLTSWPYNYWRLKKYQLSCH